MRRSGYFFVLGFLFLIALFGLVYPIYVIRPFRAQGAAELRIALLVLRYRGLAEAVSVIGSILTVALRWRASRFGTRVVGVMAALLVSACAILSRVNVY